MPETQGQWGTVRDMRHEVGAEPPDHRTGSAGLEGGEVCQTSLHSPQPQFGVEEGGAVVEQWSSADRKIVLNIR